MPCHILRVFACKMNCGAVEEMKKTKIYNDNKLKLKDISGDHRFIQARRLFNIKVSNPHRHLTLFAIYFTCMALHRTRVNFMQVTFLNWHLLLLVNVNSERYCQPILVGFKITET